MFCSLWSFARDFVLNLSQWRSRPFTSFSDRDYKCTKSATTAQSCRESMNLAASLIGLDGAETAASSPRVVGLCQRLLLGKRPRKQAKVLTVQQIIIIERLLMSPEAELIDRVFAGRCLFLLYARLRWSDAEHIEKLFPDVNSTGFGYLQAESLGSKTSTSAQQKTTFLPFVCTANGLEVPLWHEVWLKLRARANLLQLPREDREQGPRRPFMPGVTMGGSFSSQPMASSEGSKFLRAILRQGGQTEEQVSGISSHSLKATVLSWLRKYGVDPFHSKVAGYHAIKGEGSMFSYARDNVSATLRVIDEVLDAVKTGQFQLDSTRSGYFDLSKVPDEKPVSTARPSLNQPSEIFQCAAPATPTELELQQATEGFEDWPTGSVEEVEFEVPLEVDSKQLGTELTRDPVSSDSSSSDSDTSESDSEGLDALSFVNKTLRAGVSNSTDTFAVHKFHKTLHKCHAQHSDRLACGRKLHDGYTVFSDEPVSMFHKCGTCYGTVVEIDP